MNGHEITSNDTIAQFRESCKWNSYFKESLTDYREQLKKNGSRQILYNAFVAILLGDTGMSRKPECKNMAIGQGMKTDIVKEKIKELGLMDLFMKYKKDNLDYKISLLMKEMKEKCQSQLEDIIDRFCEIVFDKDIGNGNLLNNVNTETENTHMVCKNCGEEIVVAEKARFCNFCGASIEEIEDKDPKKQEEDHEPFEVEEDQEFVSALKAEMHKEFTDEEGKLFLILDYDRKSEVLTLLNAEGKVVFSEKCDCPTVRKDETLFIWNHYVVQPTYYIKDISGGMLIYKSNKWKIYSIEQKNHVSVPTIVMAEDEFMIDEFDTMECLNFQDYKYSYNGKYGILRFDINHVSEDMIDKSTEKNTKQPIVLADCIYDKIDQVEDYIDVYKAFLEDEIHIIYDYGICVYYTPSKYDVDIHCNHDALNYIVNDRYFIKYMDEDIKENSKGKIILSQDVDEFLYAGEYYSEKYEIFYVNANTYQKTDQKYYIVREEFNDKYKVLNDLGIEYGLEGDSILPITEDSINTYFFLVKNNGYYGVFGIDGKVIVPPIFTDFKFNSKNIWRFDGSIVEKKMSGRIYYADGDYRVEYTEAVYPEYECFESSDFTTPDCEQIQYEFVRDKFIIRLKAEETVATDQLLNDHIQDASEAVMDAIIWEEEDDGNDSTFIELDTFLKFEDNNETDDLPRGIENSKELINSEKLLSKSQELILGGHIAIYYDEDEWRVYNTDVHEFSVLSGCYQGFISYGNILICKKELEFDSYDFAYYHETRRSLEVLVNDILSAGLLRVTLPENEASIQWLIRCDKRYYLCKDVIVRGNGVMMSINDVIKYKNQIHFTDELNYFICKSNSFKWYLIIKNTENGFMLLSMQGNRFYYISHGILSECNWRSEGLNQCGSDFFKVSREGLFGFINAEGCEIVPLQYSSIDYLGPVEAESPGNGKLYLTDLFGKK